MNFQLWTLIPTIFLLTAFYLFLGNNGYWIYTQNDFLFGNAIVSLGIGFCYIGEGVYNKFKEGDKK